MEKASVLANEAAGQPVIVTYGGDTFTIPPGEEWDIAVLEAAEEGKVVTAAKLLLGDEQWKRFRASHQKVGEIKEFFEAAGEATGGNS